MKAEATTLGAAPRFMLSVCLLFWGWQNAYLPYALAMALILELPHWQSWRWSVAEKDFNNVADLSSILFFILVIYVFSEHGSKGIFILLSLAPFSFFLLVLTQLYSAQGRFKLKALFVSLRRLDPERSPEAQADVDITLPYCIICLVSSSAGNQRTLWYFVLLCLLFAWLLWHLRPARYKALTWLGLLVLSCALAWVGQSGIRYVQYRLERSFLSMFDDYMWRYRDPNRTTTAIGMLGRLKASDKIVLRLEADARLRKPLLLREATYNTYAYGVWSNPQNSYTVIDQAVDTLDWTLNAFESDQAATISTYMAKEIGVIPLPHGAARLRDVGAIQIEQSPYGTINMEMREGWINYGIDYQDSQIADAPPTDADLYVSENYRSDFEKLSRQLELRQRTPSAAVSTIEQYFADNFYYSLNQRQRFPRGKYLSKFLFETRQGHCEFFATSTVLLLRSAGIPARYAVGYSVQEYSPLEGRYIARARHAHSWALAYVDNNWRVIDTTPATWAPYEEENASPLQGLGDLWSWLSYQYSRWQAEDKLEEKSSRNYLLWLLIPLALFLLWRLYGKERVAAYKRQAPTKKSYSCTGLDSSLYKLIKRIEGAGFQRQRGETLRQWFQGLQPHLDLQSLRPALEIHYRYRFDPAGIESELKDKMDEDVNDFISKLRYVR